MAYIIIVPTIFIKKAPFAKLNSSQCPIVFKRKRNVINRGIPCNHVLFKNSVYFFNRIWIETAI